MSKTSSTIKINKKTSLVIGGISGLIGALAMLPYMMAVNLETGSPNIFNFQIVYAILFDNNLTSATIIGLGLHFTAGALTGMVFGVIITQTRFLPSSLGSGISWGIVGGVSSFFGLFVPTMSFLSNAEVTMLHIEAPNMPIQAIETMVQSSAGMTFNSSLLDHVLYGAVLGAAFTLILFKKFPHLDPAKNR